MSSEPSLRRPSPTPLLVSFSGLDGAGKSTQIDNLRLCLQTAGYRVKMLAFWDHVVVLSRYRGGFVHKVYGSEIGVGAPDRPVQRRDKNVRRWYLTLARHALYLLDALHLLWMTERARGSGAEVIIFDRYIYDEWANLPLKNPLTRAYIRILEAIVPRPDVAYLLDAEPVAACLRKPEYPLQFMRQCRTAYHALADLLGTMTTIPPLPLDQAKMAVEGAMRIALADEIGLSRPDRIEQLPAA